MPGSAKADHRRAPFKARPSSYAEGALSTVCAKTRLCKFYSSGGSCPRGNSCKFAHGEGELQVAPDLSHTKMCPNLLRYGVCKRGPSCRFAHSDDELRPIAEAVPKPALAAALASAWQEKKSDRWNDCSTDASDGAESDVGSLGRDTHANADDLGDVHLGQDRLPATSSASTGAEEVLVVDQSFLETASHLKEGFRFFHRPTGMPLAIRNTFFDIDDRTAGPARRCCSVGPRIGTTQPPMPGTSGAISRPR